MDPIILFLKDNILPKEKGGLIRCGGRLHDFGCSRTKSCTNAFFLGRICYASILK